MSKISTSWRRGLAAGAVATLLAGLVTACGGDDAGGEQAKLGKDDVLTITTFSNFGYEGLIKDWNADPDRPFTVKETVISEWDTWKQSLTSGLQAGTGLTDIVAVEGDAMPAFLAEGASDQFVDLSDPDLEDRWIEAKYLEGQTADGKQIGYPTDAGPEAFCYRADLFKKAGLPSDRESAAALFKDWDTYFATGEKFVKKVPNTKWYDSTGSIAQAMLNQVEFPFQTKDQKVDADNPELRKVFDTVSKYSPTLSTQVVQWKEDWMANFTNDGFATMPCPGWMFNNIKDSAPDVKGWDIVDAFPGGGGNWGGSFLSVPTQSKHQEEAKEFANYLTNAESEVAASKVAGNFPANLEAGQMLAEENAKDPYFNNAPTSEILANRAAAVPAGVPFKGDKYSDILGLFQQATQRVDEGISPDKSWETFLQGVEGLS
ncbi:cellobiose transport system substrate-binding protein [Nocardioides luteus]|uniref:Sugar ABC transporter substrate-binding protein n=1 Tax=Nocardioides luteus TaxID=1844 RepID=A0ABQ5SXF3_9ACTN|nr:extracellular solute-binding protein [Nocardioides luteus]MDR7312255.1 cellobiose transport system substrate-binding protein [Nocardioides luteus]GGR57050.1 sugar ABC transporter substrate-binding protein [Nocardioides luteus]GLJ68501.1 sugar ABC transporter substrate-binding protein [Nocardioides luteus]